MERIGPRSADVVVVGGGVTGCFAAYALASRGLDVLLVERDDVARHASGANPGGLNPLHGAGIPGPLEALARESFALHARVRETLGASDPRATARRPGRIQIAMSPADLPALEATRAFHEGQEGFSARWLDREELLALEPRLHTAVVRGLLTEGAATVEARPYVRAIADAAGRLGARLVHDEVRELVREGARVAAVVLSDGPIAAGAVVLATGPWVERAAAWLGCGLPIEPVKGELLLARVAGRPFAHDFAWRDAALYALASGDVWLGGTEERVGFDETPSQAGCATILERVRRMLPAVVDARILRRVSGLRPVTPDGLPICGHAPGWENVVLALGAGRKGMLLGAGLGRAAADLVVDGHTRLPIGALGLERFGALPAPRAASGGRDAFRQDPWHGIAGPA